MGVKRKKSPKLVTVEWKDILGTSGWEKPEEVNPPSFWTTGWLISQSIHVIKVATTKDEKGEWSAITAFPAGCVNKIKTIQVKKRPKKNPS